MKIFARVRRTYYDLILRRQCKNKTLFSFISYKTYNILNLLFGNLFGIDPSPSLYILFLNTIINMS